MTSRSHQSDIPKPLRTARLRLLVVGLVFIAAYGLVTARLYELSLQGSGQKKSGATATDNNQVRAEIQDRNGVMLATTLRTASVFADPAQILDADDAAAKLNQIMPDESLAGLTKKLKDTKRFVWLKRNITPRQEFEINKLGLPGIDFRYEEKRIYPSGELVAHALGYADRDGNGIAGVEKTFDEQLKTKPEPLVLSIDSRLQHILRREALAAKEKFNAIGAAGLILDIKTGEILAMTSLPDFDPNDPGDKVYDSLDFNPKFNRTTLGVYELGSTFKLLTASMALESGKVKLTDKFDASQPLKVGRFTIHDYKGKNRALMVPEIIQYSSNIGTARMALAAGTENQRSFLSSLGLLERPKLEVPELGRPLLPNPWGEVATMTVAFGHGISITPLQMVTAVAAVANDGVMHPPTLIKKKNDDLIESRKILSNETSEKIRKLMRLVVTDGSGTKANVPGYLIGGKTGTAEKVSAGHYNHSSLLSTFVGVFPMTKPQYLVMIMVDEPKGNKESYGYATAGWVAAPAVGHVISEIGPLLGVKPVDEKDPKVIEAMRIPGYTPDSVKKAEEKARASESEGH